MLTLLRSLKDFVQGKSPFAATRSSQWPEIRSAFLVLHPTCAVCGGKEKLEVHHISPYHLHPELELDPSNLITLCESKSHGVNCHLFVGHLGNFSSFNVDVIADAATWNKKIRERPA